MKYSANIKINRRNMQKTILEMADRLRFDKLTIGQLKQLSEYVLELETEARQHRIIIKRDKQRISELEVAIDMSDAIIKSYDKVNWIG
jgi:hypothetical protein